MLLAVTSTTVSVYAADEQSTVTQQAIQASIQTTVTQQAIQASIQEGNTLEEALTTALKNNPENAEAIIAAAIEIAADDEALVKGVLTAAVNAGVPADTVTAVAIANNVDATVASQATAAGATPATPATPASNGNPAVKATPASPSGGGGGGSGGVSEINNG